MRPVTKWLCHQVLRLDKIPRYGRLYPWAGPGGVKDCLDAKGEGRPTPKRAVEWRYRRHGYWGFHLLGRLGLLDDYIDATQTFTPTDPDIPIR